MAFLPDSVCGDFEYNMRLKKAVTKKDTMISRATGIERFLDDQYSLFLYCCLLYEMFNPSIELLQATIKAAGGPLFLEA